MGVEIERKFLVDAAWRPTTPGVRMRQGYLSRDPSRTVRVRIGGEAAWLTVKGRSEGISRSEFEFTLDLADASAMMALCEGVVEKVRHVERHASTKWEIDVFGGANLGLVMAEV